MFKAIVQIQKEFDKKGINYSIIDRKNSQIIQAGIPIENGPSIMVLFIAHVDTNDISIRVFFFFFKVKKEKRLLLLDAINNCNDKFRFFKFSIDSDNDVNVEYDFLTESSNIGPMAFEALVRISSVLDDAYPILMGAVYSK